MYEPVSLQRYQWVVGCLFILTLHQVSDPYQDIYLKMQCLCFEVLIIKACIGETSQPLKVWEKYHQHHDCSCLFSKMMTNSEKRATITVACLSAKGQCRSVNFSTNTVFHCNIVLNYCTVEMHSTTAL